MEDRDYTLSLQPDESDGTVFYLDLKFFKTNYEEEVDLSISGVQWVNPTDSSISSTFPSTQLEFKISTSDEDTLGLIGTIDDDNPIKQGVSFTANYGVVLSSILPQISIIAITLNIIKMIPMFPTLFAREIKSALHLFYSIKERDAISKTYNDEGLYPDNYFTLKTFRPSNKDFSIVSIYPRINGLNILLRILVNIFFLVYLAQQRKKQDI